MTRQERQSEEVETAFTDGHIARALVLAREHLLEFPDDEFVRQVAVRATRLLEQRST